MQAGQETAEEGAGWGEGEEGLAGTFHRPGGRTLAPAEGRIEGGCCCSSRGRSQEDQTGAGLEIVALSNRVQMTSNPSKANISKNSAHDFTDDELKMSVQKMLSGTASGLPLL